MQTNRFFTSSMESDAIKIDMAIERLDLAIADELKDCLVETVQGKNMSVIVDVSSVNFVDSSGLGALVGARKKLQPNKTMALRNASPNLTKLLKLTRLDRVFET